MTEWKTTLAGEALAGCTRDRFTDYCADAGGLCLAPTWLIADAMARSSKIRETLTAGMQAKKLFDLPAAVESAEVLFFGGGGTDGRTHAHHRERPPDPPRAGPREDAHRRLGPGDDPRPLSAPGPQRAGLLRRRVADHRRRRARRQQLQAALRQRRVEGGHARGGQRPHGGVRRPPEGPRPSAGGRGHLPRPRPGRGVRGGPRAGGSGPAPVRRSRDTAGDRGALRGEIRLDGVVRFGPVELLAPRRFGRPAPRGAVRAVAGPPLKRRSGPHSRSEERDHRGHRSSRRRQPPADRGGRGARERPCRLLLPLRLRRPAPPPHAPPAGEVPPGGSRGARADGDGEVRPAAPVGAPPVGGVERERLQLLPPVGRAGDPGAGPPEPGPGHVHPLRRRLHPVRRRPRIPRPRPHRRPPLPGRDLVRRARQVDPPGPGAPARAGGGLPVRGGRRARQRPGDAPHRRGG